MSLKDYLISINACDDAIEWVGDITIEQAVAECHRGDWMLFIAQKLKIDKRKLVLTAGHCANRVRDFMIHKRSLYAVDAAIAYGEGRITEDELKAASRAASGTAYYSASAASAAAAAASAAYYASNTAAAFYAAATAAYAAYHAAIAAYADSNYADANYAIAAKSANQKQTADICRKYIGDLIIESFNNQIT